MKLIPLLLLTLALAPAQEKRAPPKLTTEELRKLLDDPQIYYLDVRELKEVEEFGTVSGAAVIPVGEVERRKGEVPRNKKIIVGCRSGGRAGKAAATLEAAGYRVTGITGLLDWKEKGYPLVHPKASPE